MASNALMQMMQKKKNEGKEMDPMVKDSKMSVLKSLKNEMSGIMKGDLAPKQKVEVAANDSEGLKEGLGKAQELLGSGGDEPESAEEENNESKSDELNECMDAYKADPSKENLEKLMMELAAKKADMI